MFHPVSSSFQEDFLDFHQQSEVHIVILIVNQVNHLANGVLSFLELEWVFLRIGILVVCQKWLNKVNQLINSLS
jgi:hypothetical protein